MTLSELRAAFRVETGDTATPYLWADTDLNRWLNEAEREACIRAKLIIDDSTASVATYAVTSGTANYALHSSVIRVIAARFVDEDDVTYHLSINDRDWLDDHYPDWEDGDGKPTHLIAEPKSVRIVGTPTADGTLYLRVQRLPQTKMSADGHSPEIQEQHQDALLHWAKHRAYSSQDSDGYDQDAADRFEARFTQYFGPRDNAKARAAQARSREPVVKSNW